jgi:hypothetical protein
VSDIFLSYASPDRERARVLAAALEGRGWSVFWDREIPAGVTWREHIGGALKEARCLVVAWSAAAIASRWVIEEAEEGAQRGILIPVLLEPVLPPLGLRSIQALDLSQWTGEGNASELQRLAKDIGRLLGGAPAPRDQEQVKARFSTAVPYGLLTLNYLLLLYTIRVGWFFFVPLKEYLLSAASWPQIFSPLVLVVPPVRSALRPLRGLLRDLSDRWRAVFIAAGLAVSLLLVAVAWGMTPRLDLQVMSQGIDAGESGSAAFQEVFGGSVAADRLCVSPQAARGSCEPPLPGEGHLRLKIRLGPNRLGAYRLRLEGAPPEVGFARVRVDGGLVAAANGGGVTSSGPLLELTATRPASPALSGAVEARVVCRQLEADLAAEPTLHATLTALGEESNEGRSIGNCWSLANGRVGAPCPPASSRRDR